MQCRDLELKQGEEVDRLLKNYYNLINIKACSSIGRAQPYKVVVSGSSPDTPHLNN